MSDMQECLRGVRRRQAVQRVIRWAGRGLLPSAAAALVLAMARLAGLAVPGELVALLPVAGVMVGAVMAALRPPTWRQAALAVDAHYGLKDRALTALSFSQQPPGESGESLQATLRALQVADAKSHLRDLGAKPVVKLRPTRGLAAGGLLAVSLYPLLLLSASRSHPAAGAPLAVHPVAAREAQAVERNVVRDLRRLAEQTGEPALGDLAREMQQLAREMKVPGTNQSDTLAKLSEMQDAIRRSRAALDLESADAALRQVGDALAPAAAMEAAAESLQQGRYDQAADHLERLDASRVESREAEAVADNLRELAETLRESDVEKIGEAARDLAEGLERQSGVEIKRGAEQLAAASRQHQRKRDLADQLAAQLAMLAESKRQSVGNANGGEGTERSDRPKNTWGSGASDEPLAEATELDTQRRKEQLAGTLGEGASRRQTTRSSQGGGEAQRASRERYQQYRSQSEAVLQREDLPLGHRATIRRYFEAIRPANP